MMNAEIKEKTMNILVIEDEQKLASLIKQVLEDQSDKVDVAYDGPSGKEMGLTHDYDVIILDIILPGISGLDLCKSFKEKKPGIPILMLTALGTTEDKVIGFESGADDYLLKPFEFAELIARLKALTRRSQNANLPPNLIYEDANLQVDVSKKIAIRSGKKINLTAKEFLLLEYFMKNKGRVISRSELAEKIWNLKFDSGTNVVEVYINILRGKIDRDFEPKLVHTRVGFGYIFGADA